MDVSDVIVDAGNKVEVWAERVCARPKEKCKCNDLDIICIQKMRMRVYMNSRSIITGTNIHGKEATTTTEGIDTSRLEPKFSGSIRLDADAMARYTHNVIG